MTAFWLWVIAVGMFASTVIGVLLFALWLECYTRNYGAAGGPPWERRRV